MNVACLDMEGVLIPELWPLLADATGIEELHITTREFPDYAKLVARRIQLLRRYDLRLADVQVLLANVTPLAGARKLVSTLARHFRIVLVSDAFFEMVEPLWRQLGSPEHRCNRFNCDNDGYIETAHYARQHGKHEVISQFEAAGYRTLAVGDAFNDLSMLRMATVGLLYRPSEQTLLAAKGIKVACRYSEILQAAENWRDSTFASHIALHDGDS